MGGGDIIGPYPEILKAYSWLSVQVSLLVMLGGPHTVKDKIRVIRKQG